MLTGLKGLGLKEYTIAHFIAQEQVDVKLVGDTGPSAGRYATGLDGQHTFVVAESCNNADGQHRNFKRLRVAWSNPKIICNCNLRIKDIERLIQGLFGGPCDTDDGVIFYEQALAHLVARHIAYGRSEDTLNTIQWAWQHTPKLATDHPRQWFKDAEQRILAEFADHRGVPSIPPLDSVSQALSLTLETRNQCKLKHLPAIERPPEVRARERKAAKRSHDKQKRLEAGMTPRAQSISARKPWEDYGKKRAQYYRDVAAGLIPPDPGMRPVVQVVDDQGTVLRLVS